MRLRLFLLSFILPCFAYAQQSSNVGTYKFASLKLHSGKHFYTGETLGDKLKHGYSSIEVRTGWQSQGKHDWERELGFPSYGIGWYSGYVGDVDIFGNPNALFGFITFPFWERPRHNLQVEPALGVTYNLKPYNPKHNVMNDAIGAKFAVYFSMHVGGRYKLNREMDVLYGVDLTHFSNGRSVTPNMGLNMMGFSAGMRYNFNAEQRKVDNSLYPATILPARPYLPKRSRPRAIKEDNISLYLALGTAQNKDDAGTNSRYLTTSLVGEYQHKFNTKHGISIGFDAFNDPSATDTMEHKQNIAAQETFFPAAHVGYDFMFWRLAVKFQVGYNLTSLGRELKGNTFIRPAVRYEINKRLFTQIGLKTFNGATADWIEAGVGYKIFYSRRAKS